MTVKGSVNLELLRIVSPEVRSAGQLSSIFRRSERLKALGFRGR